MKFKVGDKVKVVKIVNTHYVGIIVGAEYEIRSVDENDKVHTYRLNNGAWVCDEEIELVEKKDNKYIKVKRTTIDKYNKKIDELELKLRAKQSDFDRQKGELEVYKNFTNMILEAFLNNEEEEK